MEMYFDQKCCAIKGRALFRGFCFPFNECVLDTL